MERTPNLAVGFAPVTTFRSHGLPGGSEEPASRRLPRQSAAVRQDWAPAFFGRTRPTQIAPCSAIAALVCQGTEHSIAHYRAAVQENTKHLTPAAALTDVHPSARVGDTVGARRNGQVLLKKCGNDDLFNPEIHEYNSDSSVMKTRISRCRGPAGNVEMRTRATSRVGLVRSRSVLWDHE